MFVFYSVCVDGYPPLSVVCFVRCPAFIEPSALVAADGVGFGSAAQAPRRLSADMRLRCAWPEGGSNRFSFIAGKLL